MKKLLISAMFLSVMGAFAQEDLQGQINQLKAELEQIKQAQSMPVTSPEGINPIDKRFNILYFNFQSSLDAEKAKDQDMTTKFKARQLRLEVRGNITDRIFYRFRHRLNKSNAGVDLDNLAKATDMLYAGFHIDDKWALTVGKMCQAWGGYEFDLNPMNIYEYSDFIDNMDNFMLGGMVTYTPNANHEFNLQVTDVRNDSFANIYTNRDPRSTLKQSNIPLTYIFNWNGSFFDNILQTRWGVGLQSEAEGYNNTMVMLGTRVALPKFQAFLDYMRADEQLDRLNYTPLSVNGKGDPLKDTKYNTFVLKAEYQPIPSLNLFAQGIYETAESNLAGNKMTGLGYYGGVEYLPFPSQDLRFFLAYVGRSREISNVTKSTNRVSLGMMYRIKAF
ncbi:porin [uncultured Capnocytophaga sp.]|uniref:porin n=1 Tax=uncultured Capnocytophaga sp. TaxID=159273 RepID=UPI0026139CD4|nr:porin [uncultured Capnocytophaga sp.]